MLLFRLTMQEEGGSVEGSFEDQLVLWKVHN